MLCCLLPIRRGRRSTDFHEAGMVDLTVAAQKRWLSSGRKPRTTARRAEPERGNGGEQKNGPGGRRKPLKRLDPDKEIKVNSKENPTVFQAIPTIFQGFSKEIKGFPKSAKTRASPEVRSGGIACRRPPA